MGVTKRVVLWLALAVNIVILLYALNTAGGPDAQPLRLSSVPSPEGTVEGFFRALSQRDFDSADEYISNYRTLGLSEAPASGSDALSVYIYNNIFDSYSISPASGGAVSSPSDGPGGAVSPSDSWLGRTVLNESEYKVTGSHASVKVLFTCLDTGKVSDRLTELLRDIGQRTAGSGIAVNNDEKALELFGESVTTLEKENIRQYYSQALIDIELVYTDGRWKIVLTQELYDAICGRFPGERKTVSGSDAGNGEDNGILTDQRTEESGNE